MYIPSVSIVMPTFNDSKHVAETISSVLSQTFDDFEYLIVDDCSSDMTVDVISSFGDRRIRLYRNEENMGAAAARNLGTANAHGRIIAFIDSDDLWNTQKLERQVTFMRDRKVAFSYSNYLLIDAQGKVFGDSGALPRIASYQSLLTRCYIRTSSAAYHVESCGGKHFFPNLRRRQDFALFLSLLKSVSNAFNLEEFLVSYRIRGDSLSSKKKSNVKYTWEMYREVEKYSTIESAWLMARWFGRASAMNLRRRLLKLKS